jgi:hypothetical protein
MDAPIPAAASRHSRLQARSMRDGACAAAPAALIGPAASSARAMGSISSCTTACWRHARQWAITAGGPRWSGGPADALDDRQRRGPAEGAGRGAGRRRVTPVEPVPVAAHGPQFRVRRAIGSEFPLPRIRLGAPARWTPRVGRQWAVRQRHRSEPAKGSPLIFPRSALGLVGSVPWRAPRARRRCTAESRASQRVPRWRFGAGQRSRPPSAVVASGLTCSG